MDALQGKGWPDREIAGLWHRPCTMAIAVALALGLSGCGGGGGNVRSSPPPVDGSSFAGGAVNVGSSDIVTWSANIGGSIDLIKDGTGTLVLTGTDSYSGGTTINLGTLQLGNGGTTGSIIGNVLDNGSLVFDRSDDVIFAGIVSGSGSLEQAGTGRLTLTGDNTYTGGTTISHGILQLGNGGTTGSIVGDVTDNGSLVFDRSDDVIFGGIVSGSGSLVKTGGKLLTLTGANTYAGGTTVEGGTLEIASGAELGTGSVTVGSYPPDYFYNATLKVDSGVSLSNHIVLGNSGTLDNAGALGGNQDNVIGGGGTNVTVLNHDGGSIIGTLSGVSIDTVGTVKNSSGGVIQGGNLGVQLGRGGYVSNDGIGSSIRSSAGIAVQISGDVGTVENTGGGTITGGTTAIYLQYGGSVTNGSGSTIETTGAAGGDCGGTGDCAIFVASGSNIYPHTGGALTLVNAGTIIGNVQLISTASNSVTLSAGGSIHGDLGIGSNNRSFMTLNGDAGTVQLYSQAVTGTTTFVGGLTKSGDGAWIIDNNDLMPGYTEIRAGTLQIGNGGTEGSIGPGTVDLYHGKLVFDRSDDVTFNGNISGGGSAVNDGTLVQAGTGTLTLLPTSDIRASLIEIDRGTLQIGNNGDMPTSICGCSTTLDAGVLDNGSLVFNSNWSIVFSSISGTGSVVQNGSGNMILEGADTYAGGTTINNGLLQTLGTLPGDVAVNAAGTLDGYSGATLHSGVPGVVGNLSNAGKVFVRLSDSLVGGNYTQTSTGILAVSLGSSLSVNGTATLNGGTLEVTGADSGYVSNTHTDVLTATGGVSGTFAQLVKDTGVVFTATTINYDATSVWLDTTGLNITTAAAGPGVSYTPVSMGSAERVQGAFRQLDDKIAAGNLSGVSADFLGAAGKFQQAPTLQAAQASLQSLSGQLHAASAAMTFEAIDASSRALSDRFDHLLDKDTGFGMWTQSLNVGGDMARSGFDGVGFQLNGWLVGSDRRIGRSGVAGYAFGQSQGQQRLNQSYDHDNRRSTEGMLYAGLLNGHWYTQGRVGFGHYQQDVSRRILLGESVQGVGTQYGGSYDVAYGESGLHFNPGHSDVTPFVDVEYARIGRDGFAEQGAGGFGLRSNAQTLDRWQAGLGVRAGHHWNLGGDRAVDFSARAQWQRTLASHGDVFDASFVGMQQWQPLVGIGLSRYSGLVDVGLGATLSAHTALKFSYDYEMGQRDHAQMLAARLSMSF